MELQIDDCYWCEEKITRPNSTLLWIGQFESAVCLFHPANFDAIKMDATGETAYHQSMEEVYDIIVAEHHKQKAIRSKQKPRLVDDNVTVALPKNAQRTSKAVAEKILPKTGSLRRRIYDYWVGRGDYGATDDEAQAFLGIDGNTMRHTRGSLVDDGYLVDSGHTRKNENGNDCIVWIEREHAWAKGLFL